MPRRVAAALAAASGLLVALCLPRTGLSPLGWVGLAPLLYVCARRPLREAFGLGWLAGSSYFALTFFWIYSTCRFAQIPVSVAVLAWASLSIFEGLAWGAGALFGRWAAEPLPARLRPFGWAVAWTAVSFACERWTPRLAADMLEYTQWRFPSVIQIASLTGPHGLGLLVAWVNAAVAQLWGQAEEERHPADLALPAAVFVAVWAYGAWSLMQPQPAATARVEILQPNVDQYRKWDERWEADIDATFDELLARPRPAPPALVVWPESTIPRWVAADEAPEEAAKWARKLGAAQLVGVVSRGTRDDRYNAAFLLDAKGKLAGGYKKRELVPFGEYVPLSFLARFIGQLELMGNLTPGAAEQPLLATPLGTAAVTICYESMFPRWSRADAARGARLLINVTNDGWYKDTAGPYLHFGANVFRAVENRIPVIRSGNTGISAVIDPWGRVLAKLDLGEKGRLDAALPAEDPFPRRSFYARHGDWLGALCLALAFAMACAAPGLRYAGPRYGRH